MKQSSVGSPPVATCAAGRGQTNMRWGLLSDWRTERMPATGIGTRLRRSRFARIIVGEALSPEKLALSIALGVTLGIFPLIGATTLLCVTAGVLLRLNHAALQVINQLAYPLQAVLILAFVRLGERLVGPAPVSLSMPALAEAWARGPLVFAVEFGRIGLRGVLGWAVVAPLLAGALYAVSLRLLRRAAR